MSREYSYYSTYDTYEARVARGRKNADSWQINSYLRIARSKDKPGFDIGYRKWHEDPTTGKWVPTKELTKIAHISPGNILTLAWFDEKGNPVNAPWGGPQTYQRLGLDSSTDALVPRRYRIWHLAERSKWHNYHRTRCEAPLYFHGIQFDMIAKRCISYDQAPAIVEDEAKLRSYRELLREARKVFLVSHKVGAYEQLASAPLWGPTSPLADLRDCNNKPARIYAALASQDGAELARWILQTCYSHAFKTSPAGSWRQFLRKWSYALRTEHGCYVPEAQPEATPLPIAA